MKTDITTNYSLKISWSTDDFKQQAIENKGKEWFKYYDENKFKEALDKMFDNYDSMYGITWENLNYYLTNICMYEKDK